MSPARMNVAGHRFAAGWFRAWLWVFGIAVAASLATVALGFLPQMRTLGALTLVGALCGMLVCLLGLRLYDPRAWSAVRGQVASVRDSARTASHALAEPRTVALR
jgi:hypothetical protein